MSPVLHGYLGRELLRYWLATTLVLWLVLVAARFSLYLGQAAAGQLPADTVFSLLALKSVGFFVFLLPLALFLALLWMLGRLNRDYESLALAASGVGAPQLYRAIAGPVLLALVAVTLLSTWLVPHTARLGYQLRAQAEGELDVESLQPGRFHSLRDGRWLVYATRAGDRENSLEDVFIYVRGAARPQVLVAQHAALQPAVGDARYLVLKQGYRYDGVAGQADYRVLRYDSYALALSQAAPAKAQKWDAMSVAELWRSDASEARAELHMRLARPLSVLVLVFVAVPLARFRPGLSRYFPLWLGVLVFTLYFNLLATGQLWIQQQRVPAGLGLWWVHLLVVGLFAGWFAVGRLRAARRVPA